MLSFLENDLNEKNDDGLEEEYLNKRYYSVEEGSMDFVGIGELNLMDFVELFIMRIKGNNCYKVKVLYERKRVLLGIGEGDLEGREEVDEDFESKGNGDDGEESIIRVESEK